MKSHSKKATKKVRAVKHSTHLVLGVKIISTYPSGSIFQGVWKTVISGFV
ncbi:hypothetical protein [Flavobacterium akiainvivens]|nr:hypothetical protein [Flavobacterium akiainvivens]